MRIKLNNATKIVEKWLALLAQGTYDPLIKVWSGPKGTRRHLLRGVKSGRCHHLLSDGERRKLIFFESLITCLEIYEQFPLWDILRCIELAAEMGIKYPMDHDNEAYVMSTDFLCIDIDLETGVTRKVARSYKPIDWILLESKHPISVNRTLQKLELERRYWAEEGVDFELITDAHISKNCATNLKWARSSYDYQNEFISHKDAYAFEFLNIWKSSPQKILSETIHLAAKKIGICYSDAFAIFQYLVWTHVLPVDLETLINPMTALRFKGGM